MNDENLYPELVDYIYDFQWKFRTEDENTAARAAVYLSKNASEGLVSIMKQKGWISEDETTKKMLADGFDAFKRRVVNRIYLQHKREMELNCCPKCGKITRTPLSKQCRFCFYSWH